MGYITPETFCSFLLGIVAALAGVWFTHVKNAVSRSEMQKAIDASRAHFASALRVNGQLMKELGDEVHELAKQVAVLAVRSRSDAAGA